MYYCAYLYRLEKEYFRYNNNIIIIDIDQWMERERRWVSFRTNGRDIIIESRAVKFILDTRSSIRRVSRVNNPGKQEQCSTSKETSESYWKSRYDREIRCTGAIRWKCRSSETSFVHYCSTGRICYEKSNIDSLHSRIINIRSAKAMLII